MLASQVRFWVDRTRNQILACVHLYMLLQNWMRMTVLRHSVFLTCLTGILKLPDAKRIVRLFRRRRPIQIGLKGLRSLRDRFTRVKSSSEMCRDCSFRLPSPFSESTIVVSPVPAFVFLSSVVVELDVEICFNRAFRAFWYRRLRSLRYVSRKRRNERQLTPAKIVRNQNTARQPKAVVNAPPRIGPSD